MAATATMIQATKAEAILPVAGMKLSLIHKDAN
jgi:hypothetical protein